MPDRRVSSPYRNAVCKRCDEVTRHIIIIKGKAKPRCTCLNVREPGGAQCNAYFKTKK